MAAATMSVVDVRSSLFPSPLSAGPGADSSIFTAAGAGVGFLTWLLALSQPASITGKAAAPACLPANEAEGAPRLLQGMLSLTGASVPVDANV